jgi:hypothetical protein
MNHPIGREDPIGQAPIPVTNLPDSKPISTHDRPPLRTERADITRTPRGVEGSPRTSRTQLIEATKALAANQREHAVGLAEVKAELADFRQETRATFRSVDEQLVEIKDLIIGRRDGQ